MQETIKQGNDIPLESQCQLIKELYPFQIEGVKYIVQALKQPPFSYILADEMGLGKTWQAIVTVILMRVKNVIVVCPASVREEWERILGTYTGLSYVVFYGPENLHSRARFFIISYDHYWRYVEQLPRTDMIILDEFTKIKSRNAKRSKAVLSTDYKYKLFLSGTPVLNRTEELWTVLHYMMPKEYKYYNAFIDRYCVTDTITVRAKNGHEFDLPVVKGSKNVAELAKKLEPIMLRRRREDILDQLPPRTFERLFVDLSTKQKSEYNKLQEQLEYYLEDYESSSGKVLTLFGEMRQVCQMLQDDDGVIYSSKIDLLHELVEDLVATGEHRLFIVTPYIACANAIAEDLSEYGPILVTGETDHEKAHAGRKGFQAKESPVYVGTLRKNSEGITLTMADYCVFVGKDFVPAVNSQVMDRIYRIGQEKPVTVIDILTRNTVEDRIEELLQKKTQLYMELFGSGKLGKKALELVV